MTQIDFTDQKIEINHKKPLATRSAIKNNVLLCLVSFNVIRVQTAVG